MKKVLIIIASLEKANLHRSFYEAFLEFRNQIEIIPFLFPRSLQTNEAEKKHYNENIRNIILNYNIDLVVVIGGFGLTEKAFEGTSCKKISWQIDDPYTVQLKLFPRIMNLFDCNYTTSKFALENLYQKLDIPAKYMPFGFNPLYHFPVDEDSEEYDEAKIIDVSFVGTPYKSREKYIRILNKLRDKYRVYMAGANYPDYDVKGRISHVKTAEITKYSKISVNFSDQPDGFLDAKNRICEAAGSGAMLLTQNFPSLSDYFDEGKECIVFRNPKEMENKIIYYLNDDTKRDIIVRDGTEKAFMDHRYKKKVCQILKDEAIL